MYVLVTAGRLPNQPIREFTRRWDFLREPKEHAGELTEEDTRKVRQISAEAHAYARSIENPGVIHWVKVAWYWL